MQELVKKLFFYRDGELYWKFKVSDKINAGQLAGSVSGLYKIIRYQKRTLYAHRLIFLYHHGYLPTYIDHIDGNRRNNKIENLRECSVSQNLQNRKKGRNKCKYKGITFDKRRSKWVARIKLKNKRLYLGYFLNEKDAATAYNEAALKYFNDFANLNNLGD